MSLLPPGSHGMYLRQHWDMLSVWPSVQSGIVLGGVVGGALLACSGGCPRCYSRRPPAVVTEWTRQLLDALAYLHGQGVVHRSQAPSLWQCEAPVSPRHRSTHQKTTKSTFGCEVIDTILLPPTEHSGTGAGAQGQRLRLTTRLHSKASPPLQVESVANLRASKSPGSGMGHTAKGSTQAAGGAPKAPISLAHCSPSSFPPSPPHP